MTTTLRNFRAVDALTGTKAPSKYMEALSEADSFCREVAEAAALRDRNAELDTRVQELTAELDEARALTRQWRDTALAACPHIEDAP